MCGDRSPAWKHQVTRCLLRVTLRSASVISLIINVKVSLYIKGMSLHFADLCNGVEILASLILSFSNAY